MSSTPDEKLKAAKRPGESFSATVRRARFGPSDATGKTILASMDGLTVRPVDLEAVEYWSSGDPTDIGLRRPTLDDVFIALTGHGATSNGAGGGDGEPAGRRRGFPGRRRRRV